MIKTLIDEAAPQLIAEPGIGYITAATLYFGWSHPGRYRSHAAYARLAGVAPVPAKSGQTQDRHRLNRRGDRQLNKALYMITITRVRCDPETIDYKTRRRADGKTDREINRCLERYIARRVWRLLEHHHPTETSP